MKKKINRNLLGIASLAILLTLVMTLVLYFQVIQKQILEDLQVHVHILSSSEELMDVLDHSYDPNADNLRVTIVDEYGDVIYESDADLAQMENHLERPEIKEAMRDGRGQSTRKSSTLGTYTIYYAELLDNGTVLRVAREFKYFADVFKYIAVEVVLVFGAIFALCICLGHFLTKRFLEPIEILAENVDRAEWLQTYPEIQPFIETIHEQHTAIKKNVQMRQEFTANVSHELKTPLTSISGYAELIEAGIATENDSRRFAGEIHKNSQRLLVLINDILRLSQLDSIEDYLEKESVDLYDMAKICKDMLEIHAENKLITFVVEGDHCIISANRQMIDELIFNLCDNAIRYTNNGGRVVLSVGQDERGAFISVKDNGIGISEKDQERIFERFYRVDKSRSKQTGGTGLGLAIVKHIAGLHDAEITLKSEQDVGTEITVIFKI